MTPFHKRPRASILDCNQCGGSREGIGIANTIRLLIDQWEREHSESNEAWAACEAEASGRIGQLESVLYEIRRLARIAMGQPINMGPTLEMYAATQNGLLDKIISHCNVNLGDIE